MAANHGSSGRLYAAGYDLSSFLREVSTSGSTDTAETTVFTDTAKTFILGLADGELSAEGLYFGGTNELDEILNGIIRVNDKVFIFMPAGDSNGARAKGIYGANTKHDIKAPINDVVSVSLEAMADGKAIDQLIVHHALAVEASSSNTTAQDNTTSSANGGVGYLTATGITAGSSVVKVQHSVDNSVWADLITFTAVTARTSERIAVTGTVNRYTRVLWTNSGGNPTFQVAFGRK